MKYLNSQNCKFKYPVISMGTFDGVHLGHQKLLQELTKRAKQTGGESVVITYHQHPLEIIHKKTFPYLLTECDLKEKFLKELGIDCILYLEFDAKMAEMSPSDFLKEILLDEIGAKEMLVGYDTHFGKFRAGNYEFLKQKADEYDYQVTLVEPYKINNRIISSSLIRDFVREGDLLDAARCLGRNYSIIGNVVKGQQIGRDIGFPTINLQPSDTNKLIPGIGVYVCEILWKNKHFMGTTNIGYSPTIKKNHYKEIETFILDFDANIYNEPVEIIFHKKLRDELDFASTSELIDQIKQDVENTRKYFQDNPAKM